MSDDLSTIGLWTDDPWCRRFYWSIEWINSLCFHIHRSLSFAQLNENQTWIHLISARVWCVWFLFVLSSFARFYISFLGFFPTTIYKIWNGLKEKFLLFSFRMFNVTIDLSKYRKEKRAVIWSIFYLEWFAVYKWEYNSEILCVLWNELPFLLCARFYFTLLKFC